MGARPMARVIQEKIKRRLAEEILFGRLDGGGHVDVDVAEDKDDLVFDFGDEQDGKKELATESVDGD